MVQRKSFVFYRSFYEAVLRLEPKEQLEVLLSICDYALDGTVRELEGAAAAIFLLVQPNLDANQRRYESGKRGGRPKTGGKPNANQIETEPEPDEDEDEDVYADEYADADAEGAAAAAAPPAREKPPTLAQVAAEARANGCPELARPFFDYYAAAGWRDREGRPVRSWRQKFQSWKLREFRRAPAQPVPAGRFSASPPDYQKAREDIARMEKYLRRIQEKNREKEEKV